jgi:hypothetical protein
MTAGWIVINVALALVLSALVAGVAVLVPHRLHRHAMRHDPAYARYHVALVATATRAESQRRTASRQRHPQAA